MNKAVLVASCVLALSAARAEPAASIAVFDMQLLNTSPAPSTPAEIDRTRRTTEALRAGLATRYQLIDVTPVRAAIEAGPELRNCNGCELDYGRRLGAHYVAVGWVQKVSNLILNINVAVEDVSTGKTVLHGSVDIRGNTDESWQRGLSYLLDHQILNH